MEGLPNVVFVPAGVLLLIRVASTDWCLPVPLSVVSSIELFLYLLTLLCLYLKVVKPIYKAQSSCSESPAFDLVKAFCLLADIELKVCENREVEVDPAEATRRDYVSRLLKDLESSYSEITATPKPTAKVTLLPEI